MLRMRGKKRSARDKAYIVLKQCILDGKLKPGEFVNERELAIEIGISRTPIREAMGRLETESLVRVIPGKGSFVTSISFSDVQHLFDVREALECLATRLAGARIAFEPALKDRLKSFCTIFEQFIGMDAYDVDGQLRINRDFHVAIADIAQNSHLSHMLSLLNNLDRRVRLSAGWFSGRSKERAREHLAVATALIEGEQEQAVEMMRRHIRAGKQNAIRVINGMQSTDH